MKKYLGVLLLLPLVLLVMAQFATAQDTMSAVLSTPYNSRPGSQLVYFFTQSVQNPLTAISGGDTYRSFMTITNTSTDTAVLVHFQFYNIALCTEVFDYVDVLTPQDTTVINPADLRVNATATSPGDFRGVVEGGRFLLTATAIDATLGQGVDTRAISFNYLVGQQFTTNLKTGSAVGGNAVSRMAVNAYGAALDAGSCFTTPKDFPSRAGKFAIGDAGYPAYVGCNVALQTPVAGFMLMGLAGTLDGAHATVAAGTNTYRLLQLFRPATLIVPHFFAPSLVDATANGKSLQFGNRLTLVSVQDIYNDLGASQFKLYSTTTSWTPWFIDNDEQPFSLPTRTAVCVTEYVLSPRTPGGVYAGTGTIGGIGADFIGSGIYAAVNNGGYIKMNTTGFSTGLTNWFGWFSQSVSDTSNNLSAGVGDLLVGLGRKDVTATTIVGTTTLTVLPATEATYIGGVLTSFPVPASSVTP